MATVRFTPEQANLIRSWGTQINNDGKTYYNIPYWYLVTEKSHEFEEILPGHLPDKLKEIITKINDNNGLIITKETHICGNQLTDKEIFHDHCLKCEEQISND